MENVFESRISLNLDALDVVTFLTHLSAFSGSIHSWGTVSEVHDKIMDCRNKKEENEHKIFKRYLVTKTQWFLEFYLKLFLEMFLCHPVPLLTEVSCSWLSTQESNVNIVHRVLIGDKLDFSVSSWETN